jgi:MFS family permease
MADPATRRRFPFGDGRATAQLYAIQGFHAAGEAMFAVSLAGSLFFNVSLDASRSRILLYLALTLAPFAILGPLIGPFIDKVRGGHRIVLATTLTGRAIAVALLSTQVQSLWLYPLAFGVLVLARTYSVTRNAIVPALVPSTDRYVTVNSRIALIATIAGAVGSAMAVGVLTLGDAGWVLRTAVIPYSIGALLALGLRNPERPAHLSVTDLVEMVGPAIRSATSAMAGLRAAIGYSVFHLAFALKASGAPTWFFGAMFGANGLGALTGTLVAPWLKRHLSERRILTFSLAAPAVAGAVTALRFHEITVVAFAYVLGVGAATGRRAFDSVVQTHAPHGSRGNAYAVLETRLELSWVAGALVAVVGRAAGWIGIAALAAAMGSLALVRLGVYRFRRKLQLLIADDPLPHRLLLTAERVAELGDHQQAVVLVGLLDEIVAMHPDVDPMVLASAEVAADRRRLVAMAEEAPTSSSCDATEALAAARSLLQRLGFVDDTLTSTDSAADASGGGGARGGAADGTEESEPRKVIDLGAARAGAGADAEAKRTAESCPDMKSMSAEERSRINRSG